ncbi:MAG: SDR family NAD(P)-dependent oxidoreductase [Calditrichae bacterium]|nr:SDR family NAD(P)-dependent oxidoreductase [Calditrichia bacterium]NIW77938.1 SDR family NAD(P)-dependent oxidoreductase [Calditrichia bacterium]
MRLLVTGANGFIGHHLCHRLLSDGYEVVALTRSEKPGLLGTTINDPRLKLQIGDITDRNFVRELFKTRKIDAVFHLAVQRFYPAETSSAQVSLQDTNAYKTNFEGTLNLISAAVQAGVSFWIQSSAMMIFDVENSSNLPAKETDPPAPVEPNGMSVLLAEEVCRYYGRSHDLNYMILRYPGVYGRGKDRGIIAKLLHHCMAQSSEQRTVPIDRTSDFLFVHDAVNANLLAFQKMKTESESMPSSTDEGIYNRVFHIGSGEETSVAEAARIIQELCGFRKNIIEQASGKPRRFFFDISRAREQLGYQPHSLREGLTAYIKSMTK